jgi:hypothetical protein
MIQLQNAGKESWNHQEPNLLTLLKLCRGTFINVHTLEWSIQPTPLEERDIKKIVDYGTMDA